MKAVLALLALAGSAVAGKYGGGGGDDKTVTTTTDVATTYTVSWTFPPIVNDSTNDHRPCVP